MAELNTRDTKLIQYLNEAYGKEKELETALQAHIKMANERATYKKRLQDHLKETKAQAKGLERRIKQLGGKAEAVDLPGPEVASEVASKATAAATKAVAAAKGPVHALRGTGKAEKLLKNVKTELWNEYEEIGNYVAIESLAKAVGDKDTAKLAREFRKQEERMATFLSKLLPQLGKPVASEEIPAAERRERPASTSSRSRSRSRSSRSAPRPRRPAATSLTVDVLAVESDAFALDAPRRSQPARRTRRARARRVLLNLGRRLRRRPRSSAAEQQPRDQARRPVPDDRRDPPVHGLLGLVAVELEQAVERAGEERRCVADRLHEVVGAVGLEQHEHDPEDQHQRHRRRDQNHDLAIVARATAVPA